MKKAKGFTTIELMICIAAVALIAIAGTVGYVAYHFISKVW